MSITFMPAVVPEIVDSELPRDEPPPTTYEYACETCGVELHYAGKGRKPRFCPEHKKNAPKTTRTGSGQSAKLASQATDLILSLTDVIQISAIVAGFPETSEAIDEKQGLLREQVYQALLGNPNRSRSIIKMLGATTDLGLAIALGTFTAHVGSTAWNEFKEKREGHDDL